MRGSDPLARLVETLRRRAQFLALLRWFLITVALVTGAAAARLLMATLVLPGPLADALGALLLVIASIAAILLSFPTLTRLSTLSAARLADRRAGLADELSSAVWFLEHGTHTPIERVQIERARVVAARTDARRVMPIGSSYLWRPALVVAGVAGAGAIALLVSAPMPSPTLEVSGDHGPIARPGERAVAEKGEHGQSGLESVDGGATPGSGASFDRASPEAGDGGRVPAGADNDLAHVAGAAAPTLTASVKARSAESMDGSGGSGGNAPLLGRATEVRRDLPVTLLAAPDAEIATGGARVTLSDPGSMAHPDSAPTSPDGPAPLPAGTPDSAAPDTRVQGFRSEGAASGTPDPAAVAHSATSRGEGTATGAPGAVGGAARARIGTEDLDSALPSESYPIALRERLLAIRLSGARRRGTGVSADGPLVATDIQSTSMASRDIPGVRAYVQATDFGQIQVPYAYRRTVSRYLLHLNAARD